MISEANRACFCGSFFPLSEGNPEEHRTSHRARSTRRWTIGGSMLGLYGATTGAILVGELARADGFRILLGYSMLIGAGILFLGILLMMRLVIRE
jgi:hypothetical protein